MSRSEAASRRLHPLYLVFTLTSSARSLVLPGLIAVFAARKSDSWGSWVMIFFIPAAISAVAKYVSFRYRLEKLELDEDGQD